jgi:hypothetical protein
MFLFATGQFEVVKCLLISVNLPPQQFMQGFKKQDKEENYFELIKK